MVAVSFQLRGHLTGHNNWVTQIAVHPKDPDTIVSASRDKTIIVWKLTRDEDSNYVYPKKHLYGHSHFVSDVTLSLDGSYALSGAWDNTLRLWDLTTGKATRRFADHTKIQQQQQKFSLHPLAPLAPPEDIYSTNSGDFTCLRAVAMQEIAFLCGPYCR